MWLYRAHLAAGEVFVRGQFGTERVEEHLVVDLADHVARLIQLRHDARVSRLHQVTDHLVVEIVHLTSQPTGHL